MSRHDLEMRPNARVEAVSASIGCGDARVEDERAGKQIETNTGDQTGD